jgi:hypothetical protein
MRTSVRHAIDGLPILHGWPFARTTIGMTGFAVRWSRWHPFERVGNVAAKWDEIERVERTQRGIRFVFKDGRSPVVVASLYKHGRLVDAVRTSPVMFDPTLRPSTWTTI